MASATQPRRVTAADRKRPHRRRWTRRDGWRHAVVLVAVSFALFPIVWVISASINQSGSLAAQRLLPANPTLDHYRNLLTSPTIPYLKWLWNTIAIGAIVAIGQVMLSALAAFTFSRMRFTGRRAGLMTLLLVQMFPQFLAMVAIFLFMVQIKGLFPAVGLGTKSGLILIYLGGSLGINTWLMKGFFDTIPGELDDAAKVDGATHAQLFVRIILPLAAPVLAVIALLSFTLMINEFVLASIILQQPDDFTLAVGLQRFIHDRYGARWGPFAAGAMMGGIPVIALFLFLQRYVVSGLTAGSVKG